MATSNEKFLNYNGLVKLIGLIKKRINDAVGSIDLSWKTNKFVKSIAGYGTGAAPASTSGVNDTKNKLEGTYTTGCLDGTGTDVTTNKFTYIDTTYGAASTSKAGLMSSADKTKLDNLGATGASKGANLVKYDGTAATTAGSVAEAIKNLQGAVGGGDLVKSVDDATQDSAALQNVNIILNHERTGNYTKADGTPGTYKYYETRYGNAVADSSSDNVITPGQAGLMSGSDKTKLDGVATGAQVNVIEHVRLAGESTDLTVTSKRVTIPTATTTANGLMSSADKTKLDNLNSSTVLLSSNITIDGTSKGNVQDALTALNTLAAANKSAISTLQSGGLKREIISNAADWPTGTAIKDNIIYMILASIDPLNGGDPSTSASTTPYGTNNNSYNEYMYINNAWERIGSTEVNLDIDPITDDEIDTAWSTTVAAA